MPSSWHITNVSRISWTTWSAFVRSPVSAALPTEWTDLTSSAYRNGSKSSTLWSERSTVNISPSQIQGANIRDTVITNLFLRSRLSQPTTGRFRMIFFFCCETYEVPEHERKFHQSWKTRLGHLRKCLRSSAVSAFSVLFVWQVETIFWPAPQTQTNPGVRFSSCGASTMQCSQCRIVYAIFYQ